MVCASSWHGVMAEAAVFMKEEALEKAGIAVVMEERGTIFLLWGQAAHPEVRRRTAVVGGREEGKEGLMEWVVGT